MSRLVVVSNRVTQIKGKATSAGGLAVGVHAALRDSGGVWFGWSGETTEKSSERPKLSTHGKITYALVDLSEEEFEGYYSNFSNRTLWPLFHYRPHLAQFDHQWYETYRAVNKRFAKLLRGLLKPDDRVWVHDYHLIPLGQELRKLGVDCRIGFFLHIPFPAAQLFAVLPWAAELGRAFCAYDVVGFQTPSDVRQFKDTVRTELGGTVQDREGEGGQVTLDGRESYVSDFPIGIDVDDFVSKVSTAEARRARMSMSRTLFDRKLIIGVDRLDYSKGIPERIRAYGQLIEDFEKHRRGVVMLQISAPSRSDVQEYQTLKARVESISGRLNGTFSEADWVPLRYINRTHTRQQLAGFFNVSAVGLVTPLRDGMNLVAQEYVAAQDEHDPGVLVLSRFAGAEPLLREGALVVNPFDTVGTARAMDRALEMPLEERRERWRVMDKAIREHDIVAWRERFLKRLGGL